ncbi:DUF397 domain-containing protein [Streptomyces thermodiastaticus]
MNTIKDASTLPVNWWKASHSGAQSDCVECAVVGPERMAVRDSKRPTGPALVLSRDEFAGFIDSVKAGEL